MCGIVGRVNAAPEAPISEQAMRRALALVAHRGPDGEGLFIDPDARAALGHRRLAIVDLTGGIQPMTNETRDVWVAFNGEIYNHADLRAVLEARGHTFATRCDTEAIVHGFEEWGASVFSRLRGIFAIALWDRKTRTMWLARDRLGVKPLYWTRPATGGGLAFASEIKSLFAFDDVGRALDRSQLTRFLALRYVPGPATLFEGVERLQPGHALSFRDGVCRLTRFWDVPVESTWEGARPGDLVAEGAALAEQLLESVRLRLMSDVPLGIFLSGGIDSTAVAWAMNQLGHRPLKSFSIGFSGARPGESEGELPWARLAAQRMGCEHREIRLDAHTFSGSIEPLCWHLDEPLSDGACIPLLHLARRAREEVVVVLSGEGADEVFGGYPIYGRMLWMESLRARGGRGLDALLAAFFGAGGDRLLASALGPASPERAKALRYLALCREPLERRYFGVGRAFDDRLLAHMFGPEAIEDLRRVFAPLWARSAKADPLHRMLYTDTKVWLPDDLLIKADKTTMAASIELRVPFLDHELLESAWGLPARLKFDRGVGKRVLRAALAQRIPEGILSRKKEGFPVPISRWLRDDLHAACRERLLDGRALSRELLGARGVERLLKEHRTGRIDRREELWALWVLETWRALFLDGTQADFLERAKGFQRAA